MNLEVSSNSASAATAMVMAPAENSARLVPRIERCEFERLLQRAMEILNARHIETQLADQRK